MMNRIFVLLLLFISTGSLAQTKLIFHKSHSGSNATFRKAVDHDLFGIKNSNFGLAEKSLTRLDSVINLGNGKVKLVAYIFYYDSVKPDVIKVKDKRNWHLLTNTTLRHPLFSKIHALDSIKKQLVLQKDYTGLDQTVFIGFDNKK